MTLFCAHKYKRLRRGFTLTELAIVMMIVSLIMGAIWVAGDRVLNNYRAYRVNQQVALVVQNIRDYYGSTIQTWPAGWANITTTLDSLLPATNIFPTEMRRNPNALPGATPIDHAINNNITGGGGVATNGSFAVLAINDPNSGRFNAFRIQLFGLSQANCINLLMTAPLTSDVIGFVQVGTNNMAAGRSATIVKGVAPTPPNPANTLPMRLATATAWCNGATEVDFDFTLAN